MSIDQTVGAAQAKKEVTEFAVVASPLQGSEQQGVSRSHHGRRVRPLTCAAVLVGTTAVVSGLAAVALNRYGTAGVQEFGAAVWERYANTTISSFLPW